VPAYIPASAHDEAPDFSHISRAASKSNLAVLRRNALLDEDQVTAINVPSAAPAPEVLIDPSIAAPSTSLPTGKLKTATSSLAQQEKEFHHAVQPGSPISALLKSARQPLVVGPSPAKTTKESPLFRKLQAAQKDRPAEGAGTDRLVGIEETEEEPDSRTKGRRERGAEDMRKKALESQKARIVAQMVPTGGPVDEGARLFGMPVQQDDLAPMRRDIKGKERATAPPSPLEDIPMLRVNSFDAVAATLSEAFEAKAAGRVFHDLRDKDDLPDEKVFIVSWVDYCNKYGMGYALTDGSVGVHFNDSTTIVLAPDKTYVSQFNQP
jgi:cell cycle serine/threonine-protein kinase CDC5/MSD2